MTRRDDDQFNPDALRIDPADSDFAGRVATNPRKTKWQRKFVRVPWLWLDRLKGVNRGSTYRVALLLIYQYWRNGGQPIRLSNTQATADGVSRYSKGRALNELERLGLVKVERRTRKSPEVTLKLMGET